MDKGIEIVISDDGKARLREEPYCTIECDSEEAFNDFKEAMK